jgi:hypothetical protein
LITQSNLLIVLTLAGIVLVVAMAWAIWKLLKTIERLSDRLDLSLREIEKTAEDLRKTNAVLREILVHAEKGAANVEHMTEGARKFRRTLDAASGVLEFAVVPVLGNMAGVLAGSRAALSLVSNRIFRKEGRHVE